MTKSYRSTILLALLAGFAFTVAPAAANPRKITKPREATMADIERLEKKIEDQQRTIDKLLKLHQLFMQAPVSDKTPVEKVPAMIDKKPVEKPLPRASIENGTRQAPAERKVVKKEEPAGMGTIVGKVGGVPDAIVYIENIVQPVKASAAMRQEGKQFVPQVLVVTKGTTVQFPNRDAIFHNVFSLSPDNSFDLGSYSQGESRKVTMSRPGVVTVYCNMHPQMVGHVLVVPNGKYVRAGKDGFFRLTDVPVGPHRVVAWAPNAKPTVVPTTVEADQVVTIELTLKKRGTPQHVKKDGLPYGSYEK
jgi:plastocyanin